MTAPMTLERPAMATYTQPLTSSKQVYRSTSSVHNSYGYLVSASSCSLQSLCPSCALLLLVLPRLHSNKLIHSFMMWSLSRERWLSLIYKETTPKTISLGPKHRRWPKTPGTNGQNVESQDHRAEARPGQLEEFRNYPLSSNFIPCYNIPSCRKAL